MNSYFLNKKNILKLICKKKTKVFYAYQLPIYAKKLGSYDKGLKIQFHRSLWVLYPKMILYVFNAFFKKKIFFLDAVIDVLKLATVRKDYGVHCYIIIFYVWFTYVWCCKLLLGVPSLMTFPFIRHLVNFILLWFGLG